MIKEFYASDVEEITGIKRSTIESWIERKFIIPTIQTASGHGTRNIWNIEDIRKIILFNGLVNIGFKRKLAANLIRGIK